MYVRVVCLVGMEVLEFWWVTTTFHALVLRTKIQGCLSSRWMETAKGASPTSGLHFHLGRNNVGSMALKGWQAIIFTKHEF